ncbi:MAG: 23S rRNA (uracil(1939)-C(5))-methyltransferase RlmD [Legionella sp.]
MKRKRQRLSTTPVEAYIEKFSHDARGLARIAGKTTFIQGALPNETVLVEYTRQKNDYDEGQLIRVINQSPHRVSPKCPHYTSCGGCSLQHLDPTVQIHVKQQILIDLLTKIARCTPQHILPPVVGDYWNYRNKARLSVRYVEKKQSTLVGFREQNNPRFIADITRCSILHEQVDTHITALRQLVDSLDEPRNIAQIEVAAGDQEVALIFRNLTAISTDDQQRLREFADQYNFFIYLQPAGPDSVYLFYPQDRGNLLSYALPEYGINLHFKPTDFTQVNASLNRQMVTLALHLLALEPEDVVLDLYCGLGNFSLPMAKNCKWVIGVEGSEAMVQRAAMNAKLNDISNTDFYCANLDDENSISLFEKYQFDKVLLDPPRTGALTIVKKIHLIAPKLIVYVSCNPATLARDTDILVHQQGYQLVSVGVMDMFPHTAHVESIALFVKG